ncbi:MAG TPA: hypothetical protein VFE42_26370 [Chloroflexota bacterium]|nr:hypothetical protein [Chloroflexota bacterium]
MARKTMAERYAAQRSRGGSRRRSLPRLSDTAPRLSDTALLEQEPEVAEESDEDDEEAAPAAVAAARRPAARRTASHHVAEMTAAAAALSRVDYHYVIKDLRRIAITAVAMLILLVVLNIAVQALIH